MARFIPSTLCTDSLKTFGGYQLAVRIRKYDFNTAALRMSSSCFLPLTFNASEIARCGIRIEEGVAVERREGVWQELLLPGSSTLHLARQHSSSSNRCKFRIQ